MPYFIKIFVYLIIITRCNFSFASDNKAGLPQLDLTTYPSLVFWSTVSLIIGYIFMKYLVTPKIKSIINLRETNIQNDLVKAKASNQEAEKIKQTILEQRENIKLKSQTIISQAISESNLFLEKSETNISKKIDDKIIQAEKQIINTQNNVIAEIISKADELTFNVVRKFSSIKDDKVIIKQAVKTASKKILMEK